MENQNKENNIADNEINDTSVSAESDSVGNSQSNETDKKSGVAKAILEYSEMFVFAIVAVLVLFTFAFRLCQVQGASMQNTLKNDEMLITTNLFYTPKQDDIVVFHQTSGNDMGINKPVIKRVIATEGQKIRIEYSDNGMKILVDGVEYADEHAFFDPLRYNIYPQYDFDFTSNVFETTVPEGHIFVLGDNRDNSNDSRSLEIGFVDERRILGKAIFRIKPFTWLD